MELGQGRVRLGVRKRFCTQRVVRHWDRLPKSLGHSTKPTRVQQAFGQHSQTDGLIFGCSCVELRVGCNDPFGSLSTQDIFMILCITFVTTNIDITFPSLSFRYDTKSVTKDVLSLYQFSLPFALSLSELQNILHQHLQSTEMYAISTFVILFHKKRCHTALQEHNLILYALDIQLKKQE